MKYFSKIAAIISTVFVVFLAYQSYPKVITIADNDASTVFIANGDGGPKTKIGTGIIVNDEYILTALHLLEKENELTIINKDSERYEASVYAVTEKQTDLTILKLGKKIKGRHATFRCSQPELGDPLYTIGHPSGFYRMVTYGFMAIHNKTYRLTNTDYFVANMAAYFGNSGGGLFESINGYTVGIVSAIYSWRGDEKMPAPITFVVTSEKMCEFMDKSGIAYKKAG